MERFKGRLLPLQVGGGATMMHCDISLSLYPDGNLYPFESFLVGGGGRPGSVKGRRLFVDRPPPSLPLYHRNAYSAQ